MTERSFWAALMAIIGAALASMFLVDGNPAARLPVTAIWTLMAGLGWMAFHQRRVRQRAAAARAGGKPARDDFDDESPDEELDE